MANTIVGKAGLLQIGDSGGTSPVDLLELTSYTIDTTQDTAETTAMNGSSGTSYARTYVPTLSSFSGSADFILEGDLTGTPQYSAIDRLDFATDRTVGSILLFPEGSAVGSTKISGDVIITGVSITGSFDGVVTGSVTFQGTGGLTYATA